MGCSLSEAKYARKVNPNVKGIEFDGIVMLLDCFITFWQTIHVSLRCLLILKQYSFSVETTTNVGQESTTDALELKIIH
jgi:hypothetical protein